MICSLINRLARGGMAGSNKERTLAPLQMGPTKSLGYFCAAFETGRDIIQALIDEGTHTRPHVFDAYMAPNTHSSTKNSPADHN